MSKKMVTLNELLEIKDFAERVTLVNKHGNLNNQITHVTINLIPLALIAVLTLSIAGWTFKSKLE